MTDQANPKIIEMLRKVLALTSSPEVNEAAAAAAKAAELMQKFNLTMDDVSTAEEKSVVVEKSTPFISKLRQQWEVDLAIYVSRSMFCRILTNRVAIFFIGRTENVDAAIYTYNNLASQIQAMAQVATHAYVEKTKKQYGDRYSPRYMTGSMNFKHWRNSWILGASSAVGKRLVEQMKQAETSPQMSGIMVVRGAETDQFVKQNYSNIPVRKAVETTVNGRAFASGEEFGEKMAVQKGLS